MPIPVNHYYYNTTTINHVFSKIIGIILFARLQNQDKTNCLNNEIHQCIDSSINEEIDTASIVINILQKESDDLLERWIMSFDAAEEASSKAKFDFIESIKDFIHQMPAHELKSLYTISCFNNSPNQQCYSHTSSQDRIEFRQEAQLKAQRFHLPSLSLEVVYDEKPKKKPTISLQALSGPSFISWSKMQQPQPSLLQELHPLANIPTTTATVSPTIVVNNAPMIAVRRLSRLSLSAIDDEDDIQPENITNSPFAIPIPSPRMQYTHHGGHHTGLRSTFAYSTSPNNLLSPTSPSSYLDHPINMERRSSLTDQQHHGCFVGSFEESLFSGRMSSMPSKPITFHSQIGVLGYGDCKPSLRCPPHWSIVFPATFYKLPQDDIMTPYVGTVDIGEYAATHMENKPQPGYRIPPKGQLQVVVKNPNKTAVKLFLIPYNVTDMPKNTKTFLRQKSYVVDQDDGKKQLLRYAIHVQICRTEKKRVYLYKTMRIVFANRKADAREKLNVVCEGPKEPVYIPM